MAQNIYDEPAFFEGYSQLPRSQFGLDGAPEWPAIRALLPEANGLHVADLGCGFGWFARWVRSAGAAHVLGFDLSEKMLARARDETEDDAIVYRTADLETLKLPQAAFDLVYSVLALEQMESLRHRALAEMARVAGAATFMIEPFAEANRTLWRRLYVYRRDYFRGRISDLPGYGLRPRFATFDYPQETFLGTGAVLSDCCAEASGRGRS